MLKRKDKTSLKVGRQRRSSDKGVGGDLFRRGSSLNTSRLRSAAIREQRREASRRHHRTQSLTVWFVGISLLFIATAYLMITRVTEVEVVGFSDDQQVTIPDSDMYLTSINKVLDDSFMGRLQPFIPISDISKGLMSSHPEIRGASLRSSGFTKTLKMELEFRRPVLTWQTKSNQHFYIGSDGVAFKVNNSSVNNNELVNLVDDSGLGAEAGETLTSSQMIDFILELHEKLHEMGIEVTDYSLPSSLREVDVRLAGRPYTVKFLSTNDVGQEVAQLQKSLEFFTKHPEHTPTKYLDLRVIGRGFYQ